MNLKKLVAQGAVAAVLGGFACGAGISPANADPDWNWQPWDDHGNHVVWNGDQWHNWWLDHRWRDDDRPPWGWGPPPPVHWRGHPPDDFDYWGYHVHPIWNPVLAVWGFWLFGIFIPIIVV